MLFDRAMSVDHLAAKLAETLSHLPLPVAVVDLETTGGHFDDDRITEIAVWRFFDGCHSQHHYLINPQQPISPFITRLTGISNDMVVNAPSFAEVAPTLLPLLRGHVLVAHNSRFDYTFLRRAFARCGLAFAAPTLCTVQLSRRLYPQYPKHNLDSILQRCDIHIDPEHRHRAMGDVVALLQFLHHSLKAHGQQHWLGHWQALTRPGYPPAWLPENLCRMLYALPDSPGLSVWHHPGREQPLLLTHAQTFSEIWQFLQHNGAADRWRDTATVDFVPAASLLHAHALKGEYLFSRGMTAHAPPANPSWYSVRFVANHHGQLQARIVPLGDGVHQHAPYGLFAHPRGAKKALGKWARQHGLCPAVLDITERSIARHQACPVTEAGACAGHCRQLAQRDAHNAAVLRAAPALPVCDWGLWRSFSAAENGEFGTHAMLHCRSGSIKIAPGHWYFDAALPRLFKQRLKAPGIESWADDPENADAH